LDAHHVEHWAEGGETRLGNLVLLCPFHHRLVHEEGYRVAVSAETSTARFFMPNRRPIPDVPEPVAAKGTLDELVGPLPTDSDPEANLFWLDRRPDYAYVVGGLVQ
jgi:hypothetical protein